MENTHEVDELIRRAASGEDAATSRLLSMYRDRLKKTIQLRLDRRLYSRVDESDIVQEAMLEAAERLANYASSPPMEFYLWLRCLVGQKLVDAHRQHLGAKKRDAGKEISLFRHAMPQATSTALADQLLGRLTSPSQALQRAEMQLQVQDVLNNLEETDREILVLRHFEQLTNNQTAEVLGISKSAASKRFILAVRRLKSQLRSIPKLADLFRGANE